MGGKNDRPCLPSTNLMLKNKIIINKSAHRENSVSSGSFWSASPFIFYFRKPANEGFLGNGGIL